MRPQILFDLFSPVTRLTGVGPRIAALIEKVAGPHIVDLLWHLPTGLIDRRYRPPIARAEPGRIATFEVRVDSHLPGRSQRQPYKVRCADDTGFLHLVFFHPRRDYLEKALPIGEVRLVSGRVEEFNGELQITHPDHIGTLAEEATVAGVEPVYPLTAGLSLKVLGKAIRGALSEAPDLPEWQDPALRDREKWPSWRTALTVAHAPQDERDLLPDS